MQTTVARHFSEYKHSVSDFKWMVLEKVEGEDERQMKQKLLKREVYWISTLNTLQPDGMNENCNFPVFL